VVGNLFQGFSCEWWKSKHNTHHAVPNLHESAEGAHDGDPDIDTMPFLAWSGRMLKQAGSFSPFARGLLQWQAFTYFPLLFFARLTWALQSASFAFGFEDGLFANNEVAVKRKVAAEKGGKDRGLKYATVEKALILAHYAGTFALCFGATSSLAVVVAHLLVAQCGCGLLLAVAFGLGHNGMAVHDAHARPGFAALQVSTTRNVADDALGFTGWFMGGLHLQIEHHLFPAIPRHNLPAVRALIEPLCKKHGVKYVATGMADGTADILSHLSHVARALKEI
jgi:fatty acid desaturase